MRPSPNCQVDLSPLPRDEQAERRGAADALAAHVLDAHPQPSQESVDLVKAFCATVTKCAEVFAKKQADYGARNIAAFGEMGLLVRVTDKVARLTNLQGRAAANESILDSWLDIGVYGFIGVMVRGERWPGCQEKHRLDYVSPEPEQPAVAIGSVKYGLAAEHLVNAIKALGGQRTFKEWEYLLKIGLDYLKAWYTDPAPVTFETFLATVTSCEPAGSEPEQRAQALIDLVTRRPHDQDRPREFDPRE